MTRKVSMMFGILLFSIFSAYGQEMHSPAEILQIMEKSTVSYQLNSLETEILPPDRSENVNYNHYYRVSENGQISTYKYEVGDEVHELLEKAEEYFRGREFTRAREMYLEILEQDSSYYEVMTYIGQAYGIEGDFDKAIEWYTKTTGLNYIDYMAHWFLADAYKVKGELDKAVDAITVAKILNRNNPRIDKSLKEIYSLKKLKTDDWIFNPQMRIDSMGANKVGVYFDSDWLGYALVKAVWKYEPGYRESMGVSDGLFSTIEEKECFLSLISTFDKKKLKKYPEFRALQKALDKGMIDEYIIYEIVLPEYPFVAYQLPEEFINEIKKYVIEVRARLK